MKVIYGFRFHGDPSAKKRPAVIVAEMDGWAMVVPITSRFDKEGLVHDGDVILTATSSANKGTGLKGVQVQTLRVKDAALYPVKSSWLRDAEVIGELKPEKDPRFLAMWKDALARFPVSKVVDWEPIGK